MPDISALNHINHIFRHVLGVIANALNCFGYKQDFKGSRDFARIFHHESDELTHDGTEFFIYLFVLAHDSGCCRQV